MKQIKKDSRKVVFVVLMVIGLVSILVTSYSFVQANLSANKKYVITSGLLQLEMSEKEGVTLSNALPASDPVGMLGVPYEFTLTNNSKFLLKYDLILVDETEGEELIAYEDIRYGLTKDGVTTFGSIINLENMVIDSGSIETEKSITYQFRMWINHEVTEESRINGKTRKFRFSIETAKSDDDILLAATLDGEPVAEFPTIQDNYGVESITCNEDVTASFNPTTWSVTVDGIAKSNTSCIVNFSSDITLDETSDAITMSKDELYAFYKGSFAGTATSSEVLSGKTVYLNGVETVGTMPNNGSVNASIKTSGGSYIIPKGYHDGTGKVTGPTLESLVGSNVTLVSNANLLTGYTAYGKNGVKYTGSMTNQGAKTASLNAGESYTIPAGYHNGTGKVTANSLKSQTAGTATAASILSGKTAWVNGVKITGSASLAATKLNGTVTMCTDLDGQTSVTKTIVFTTPFSKTPTITATAASSIGQANNSLQVTIKDKSAGGFSVTVFNNQPYAGYNAKTVTLTWIATAS